MDEMLKELWEAANDHSVIWGGEYLEPEANDMPPRPANDEDTIRLVANYLRNSF